MHFVKLSKRKEYFNDKDLEKYKPDVILLEDNIWGGSLKLNQKMQKHNYKLFFISGNSVGFAKNYKKNILLNNFNL